MFVIHLLIINNINVKWWNIMLDESTFTSSYILVYTYLSKHGPFYFSLSDFFKEINTRRNYCILGVCWAAVEVELHSLFHSLSLLVMHLNIHKYSYGEFHIKSMIMILLYSPYVLLMNIENVMKFINPLIFNKISCYLSHLFQLSMK